MTSHVRPCIPCQDGRRSAWKSAASWYRTSPSYISARSDLGPISDLDDRSRQPDPILARPQILTIDLDSQTRSRLYLDSGSRETATI